MSYDEMELEAKMQEILEDCGEFENLDDEELYELIEEIKSYMDGDSEEAFEFLNQYSPISKKRFYSLYAI